MIPVAVCEFDPSSRCPSSCAITFPRMSVRLTCQSELRLDCPVVENIAVAAGAFSRQERLPENVASPLLRLGHDAYRKMGGRLELATARYGPRRGGCHHLPGRVKPGSFLEHRAWRALLASRPDEDVRVYVFCGAQEHVFQTTSSPALLKILATFSST